MNNVYPMRELAKVVCDGSTGFDSRLSSVKISQKTCLWRRTSVIDSFLWLKSCSTNWQVRLVVWQYEKVFIRFIVWMRIITLILTIIIITTTTAHTWSMMESRVLSNRKPRPLTRYSPSATMWLSSSSSSRASALWATALHSWWTSVRNSRAKVLLAPLMSELQESRRHQGAAAPHQLWHVLLFRLKSCGFKR